MTKLARWNLRLALGAKDIPDIYNAFKTKTPGVS